MKNLVSKFSPQHFVAFIAIATLALGFASCCEPPARNSNPVIIDSLFKMTTGLDYYRDTTGGLSSDKLYYPIWSWKITNTGTDADDFTLQVRHPRVDVGFDITRHLAAGETAIFKSPTMGDSECIGSTYYFPRTGDNTIIIPADAFYGFFGDSTEMNLNILQPRLTLVYGAVDNGPEACNTPPSSTPVDWRRFLGK